MKQKQSVHSYSVETPEEDEPPSSSAVPESVLKLILPESSPLEGPCAIPSNPLLTAVPSSRSSSHARAFRKKFFPQASSTDWNDWRWQIRNRFQDEAGLSRFLFLSPEERQALAMGEGNLPVGITPYYASLLSPENADQPLRKTVLASPSEFLESPEEAADPLGEDADSPVHGIVHRYPDRVLFLVTGFCSTFCRYCTRSRMVGGHGNREAAPDWERAIQYIEATPSVRDVLLSGGDPLTLSDERLEWLLSRLRRIPHVEMLRIGTKTPAVLPQRITPALVRVLKRFHPLWMSLHFTHPEELTPESAQACNRLADAGIPLGSQTVLLRGINDNVETMKELFHGLLRVRVRPYYLYQCDPISGSRHFRTSVEKGLEIIEGLRGHTTGYAIPHYVIDAPGGGGKIPLLPHYVESHTEGQIILRNYENRRFTYPDVVLPEVAGCKSD